ncbi:NUDIX domain-containing protein [Mangrovibacillus cuniculi]|uniref:NUDIX domain-containing protein n=1 Tax=Mangrovibacillus cuniculi TaxID=2593652 RepID=A0A7S8CE79_9BACI|nr:NUDIX domain-containing protein [Mangrovibacillus cuniculi]QPC48331.1 NUDIX domain-containing protein [Mangrovibacillus cuniculi]
MLNIRNSAKAIILESNNILLTKNEDLEGYFYLFPGGGQEHEETLTDAIKRECVEEIGQVITVLELLHVREYIGKNHERAEFDSGFHQVDFFFYCQLEETFDSGAVPINPDSHQVGVEWISLEELENLRVYPKEICKHILARNSGGKTKVYVGDVN